MKAPLIEQLKIHYPDLQWHKGSAVEIAGLRDRFDVITLYHVLEHLSDPVSAMKQILRLANPGALVVIEVPNVGGLEAKLKGRNWHYYKVDHVSYFRPCDLRRLAQMVGLQVVDVRGYQHFSYPQNVLWKDLVKGSLAKLGFRDVLSIFMMAGDN